VRAKVEYRIIPDKSPPVKVVSVIRNCARALEVSAVSAMQVALKARLKCIYACRMRWHISGSKSVLCPHIVAFHTVGEELFPI